MSDKVIARYFLVISVISVAVTCGMAQMHLEDFGFLSPHRPIAYSRSLFEPRHLSHTSGPIRDIPIIPIQRRVIVLSNGKSNGRSWELSSQEHQHEYEQDHFHYFLGPRGKNYRKSFFEGEGCLGGRFERFYEKTGTCYTLGTQGPCGPNMIFQTLPNNNKTHGTCDCDTESYQRPMVRSTNKCYFVYTQAYCGSGKWLGINEEGFPQCETNPCGSKNAKSQNVWVPFYGKCVRLNSTSKHCKRNQVVNFIKGKLHPVCSEWRGRYSSASTRRVNRQVAKVGNLKCRSGKKFSPLLKKCVKMFSFRSK